MKPTQARAHIRLHRFCCLLYAFTTYFLPTKPSTCLTRATSTRPRTPPAQLVSVLMADADVLLMVSTSFAPLFFLHSDFTYEVVVSQVTRSTRPPAACLTQCPERYRFLDLLLIVRCGCALAVALLWPCSDMAKHFIGTGTSRFT